MLDSDFNTTAEAKLSSSFFMESTLDVKPELLTITGFLRFNPIYVVSSFFMDFIF
jgi:hypothetical protein